MSETVHRTTVRLNWLTQRLLEKIQAETGYSTTRVIENAFYVYADRLHRQVKKKERAAEARREGNI